jgi:hypothetical protein
MGRCLSPTFLWSVPHFSCCWTPSPLQAHWGRWRHTCLLCLACLFTVHMKEYPFPNSGEFSSRQPLFQAFSTPRLLGRGRHSCLLWPDCLFTIHMGECPSPTLWSSGCPALFAMCLFFFHLYVYYSGFFFLFPWVGVSLSRGLCWFVPGSTPCCLFAHLVVCISQAG